MDKNKSTSIQLQVETRDELKTLGMKREIYGEIIKNLITAYNKN